jgi:hypothetical protein
MPYSRKGILSQNSTVPKYWVNIKTLETPEYETNSENRK